jgi:hypothetical protein
MSRHEGEHPLHVVIIDLQFDAITDGRGLKFFNMMVRHSRLCLAIRGGKTMKEQGRGGRAEGAQHHYTTPSITCSEEKPELIAEPFKHWCKNIGE